MRGDCGARGSRAAVAERQLTADLHGNGCMEDRAALVHPVVPPRRLSLTSRRSFHLKLLDSTSSIVAPVSRSGRHRLPTGWRRSVGSKTNERQSAACSGSSWRARPQSKGTYAQRQLRSVGEGLGHDIRRRVLERLERPDQPPDRVLSKATRSTSASSSRAPRRPRATGPSSDCGSLTRSRGTSPLMAVLDQPLL